MESPTIAECATLIESRIRLLGNLFRRSSTCRPNLQVRSVCNRKGGSDLHDDSVIRYAITVNISPFHILNRKRWFTYKHDHQRNHLARLEQKFRDQTPSAKLIELHYEVCPTEDEFHNIHFHALYEMPAEFRAELETYYQRACKTERSKWQDLCIKPIFDQDGWLTYIRKDALKNK